MPRNPSQKRGMLTRAKDIVRGALNRLWGGGKKGGSAKGGGKKKRGGAGGGH